MITFPRWFWVFVLALGTVFSAHAEITFEGGDGTSIENAVIIKGASEMTGVRAEYEYLARHFPGYTKGKQSLLKQDGRIYDLLEFTVRDQKKAIYFDITDFFGKF